MAITVEISDFDGLMKQLEDRPKELAKGVRGITLGLVKRRKSGGSMSGSTIKTVASAQARKVYNITKPEFDARADYRYDEIGSITLAGVEIPFFAAEITSRPDRTFTPAHFKMEPAERPGKRGYVVKWKPGRGGEKRQLRPDKAKYRGQPVFLAAPRGVTLPWYRLGERHKPVEVVRTRLSPPQMADNPRVQPNIQKEIEKKVETKLDELIEKLNKPG